MLVSVLCISLRLLAVFNRIFLRAYKRHSKEGGSEPQTKEYLTTSATSDQKLEYRTIWLAPLRYCLTPTTAAPKQKPVQNRSYKQSANTLCRTSRKPAGRGDWHVLSADLEEGLEALSILLSNPGAKPSGTFSCWL